MLRAGRGLAAALVAPLLLLGCSEGTDASRGDGGEASVEFRRVITSAQLTGSCRLDRPVCRAWEQFACPADARSAGADLLMTCGRGDESSQPYLLGAPEIAGGVDSAEASPTPGAAQWEVRLRLDPEATAAFAAMTEELVATSGRFAILVDATVVSAPAVQTVVTDGRVRLAGDYTEAEAQELVELLAP